MKVALTCPASLPATQFGGIMFLCVDIARELAKNGHRVIIFTTDLDFANNANTFNRDLAKIESIHGFTINRAHVWLSYQLFYVNPGMYFEMKKEKVDIIHTIGIRSFQSLVAALISKKYKIPLVISDQGGLNTHPDLQKNSLMKKIMYKIQVPIISFIVNQATKIIVPNEYEKEIFSKYTTSKKIEVVRNGISLDEIYQSKIDFRDKYKVKNNFILFLGRFNKVKGIDVLLQAWASIKDNIESDTKLVIMGVNFGFESEMYKLIEELKIKDSVIVITKPPREDVLAAYSACQFLVLPSRWELSPLTPLEGFAFKKPTISTTAHGIPYTIKDGENAILVEPENHKQLAEAILKLLKNEELRLAYGNAGYSMVQQVCNSKTMSENILRVYQQASHR
ncbi:glycosyltransferase family 4 protein [Candidatus Nitrosotenuis chungbukensis]|uniref:glycosyltransferase family 4 protein n=1 Tax=Candidatus Nitrosotenuis chungbukensis TaxID=1353246 RepID=UPI002672BC50|nr:glycosyltransferase family 4 protein [Candidatus Nitrosotenuis chungbukensis]WKT58320.1 glycosyltransferase family 4 protein [Candidatus Nitrosotenuis chungbukensis]